MNTLRVQNIIQEVFTDLGAKSPLELDVMLGVEREQVTDVILLKALVMHLHPILKRRLSNPELKLNVLVMRSESLALNVMKYDVRVKVELEDGLVIDVPITVARSVGIFLKIKRWDMKLKRLPFLTPGQKLLVGAIAYANGVEPNTQLGELIDEELQQRIAFILDDTCSAAVRQRGRLVIEGFYLDKIRAASLALKPQN